MSVIFMRLSTVLMAALESEVPAFQPEKINSLSFSSSRRLRILMARFESGTMCSLPAFIRSPGTVQSLLARSISSQVAPITSLVRAAVRIVNSKARGETPGNALSLAINFPTSE